MDPVSLALGTVGVALPLAQILFKLFKKARKWLKANNISIYKRDKHFIRTLKGYFKKNKDHYQRLPPRIEQIMARVQRRREEEWMSAPGAREMLMKMEGGMHRRGAGERDRLYEEVEDNSDSEYEDSEDDGNGAGEEKDYDDFEETQDAQSVRGKKYGVPVYDTKRSEFEQKRRQDEYDEYGGSEEEEDEYEEGGGWMTEGSEDDVDDWEDEDGEDDNQHKQKRRYDDHGVE